MSKENKKRMAIICRRIGVILMIAAVTWIIGISLDKGEFLIRDALLMLFLYAFFSIIFEIFETIITKKNNEEITEKTNIQFSNATEKEKNSLDSKKQQRMMT